MPEFLRATIEVLIGIGLLFGGGELFVKGSIALAVIFGIPQLVIGLTVVAFGTSAPELFVSLSSVAQGADALAVRRRASGGKSPRRRRRAPRRRPTRRW